jgi:uncharacterized paraquat-inducible protein A
MEQKMTDPVTRHTMINQNQAEQIASNSSYESCIAGVTEQEERRVSERVEEVRREQARNNLTAAGAAGVASTALLLTGNVLPAAVGYLGTGALYLNSRSEPELSSADQDYILGERSIAGQMRALCGFVE